jgi:pre-mRNA-splicing factor CWC22
LLAQRFCLLHSKWAELFEDCFQKQYALIHRLETNKLRNVAKLFAMLLYTDAITWGVLSDIRLTEDDTTSSSRIFIKILFQVLDF